MENLIVTEENKHFLPIEHFSASSIQEFLTNEYSFFTKYVLYDWEDKKGLALFIGSACHSALEYYYNMKAEVLEYGEKPKNPEEKEENKIKIPTQEIIQNIAMSELVKIIGYQEKKGLQEMCERKKINFDTFLEHYQELIGNKPNLIKELEEEIKKLTETLGLAELPPEDFETIDNDIISKKESIVKLKDPITRAEGFLKKYGIDDDKLEYYKAIFIDYGVIKTTLKDKKEKKLDEANKAILIAINNYFEALNSGIIPDYKPMGTEIRVKGNIEGVPVPLKGSMDLLAYEVDKNEAYPVDHKFVAKATKPDVEETTMELESGELVKLPNLPANYIIQAVVYRFLSKEFLGYYPKKVVYDECLKTMVNPASGLLKKDLTKLAEENKEKLEEIKFNWNSKTTNGDLADALLEIEVLKRPITVNRVVIDFEKYPQLIEIFLELYRRILNKLGVMAIYKLPLDFLPNFKADFSGPASWASFNKIALEGKDWKQVAKGGKIPESEGIKKVDF